MTGVNWIDAILVAFMALGAAAGAYSFARNKQTYIDFATAAIKALWPHIVAAAVKITKPYDAKTQERYDEVRKRGGQWDHRTRKERR